MDHGDRENSVNKQLDAIADGLDQRISNGVIPTVDQFGNDSTKVEQAARISTDRGLKMRVYANKGTAGTVEDVAIFIEDYGGDTELQTLIKERHGDIPVEGIEVGMRGGLRSDEVGEGRLVSPPLGLGSGRSTGHVHTFTRTYTYVSPDVTQALMERIPLHSTTSS